MSYCPYLFRGTAVTTKVLPGGVEPLERVPRTGSSHAGLVPLFGSVT